MALSIAVTPEQSALMRDANSGFKAGADHTRAGGMSGRMAARARHGRPAGFAAAMPGVAFVSIALLMGACSKAPSTPPAPVATAPPIASSPASAGSSDTSVPAAGSVLAPSAGPQADPKAGRTNGAMTRAQESSAMPMPGQNNDHSAPLGPAKGASSP